MIDGISAVTLGTHEMPRAVRFYCALGFEILHGGEESSFTSFRAGASYLNLIAHPPLMGCALLPPSCPRRPRTQFRSAFAILGLIPRRGRRGRSRLRRSEPVCAVSRQAQLQDTYQSKQHRGA